MPVSSPVPVALLATVRFRFLTFKIIKIKNCNAGLSGRAV